MAQQPPEHEGISGAMRRVVGGARDAVDGAVDATVGRVGHTMGEAAMDVTNATAQQVIEDLEPYLIEQAIPRIVAGITPYLTEDVVPDVLARITDHLTQVTIPEVVDGVTGHLVQVTVPAVVEGVTPRLVDDLLPRILTELRPHLERELVPGIVDALLPHLEQEVAPRLVDSLLPKIRTEVVPLVLDDIIEDPRVRDLIREQSQGLFLDALESVRENLADGDDIAERFGRRLVGREPRPEAESAVDLVLEAGGGGDTTPARLTRANLAEQRRAWQAMPVQPAPPGREFSHAGAVARLVGFAVDAGLVGWLLSQGLSALVDLLDSILSPVPPWLAATLTGITIALFPIYLGVAWWLAGRSLGSWLTGTRVCTPDGRNPGLIRALVRAGLAVFGLVVWVVTGVFSLFDPKRRILLDRMLHTEVRYVVPDEQQRRYIREALLARSARGAV